MGMAKPRKSSTAQTEIANRLRLLSDRCGGSSRLAEKAGVHASVVSRCLAEENSPNLSSAAAIALAGDVTLDWFATGRGSPDLPQSDIEEVVQFYDLRASAGPGLIAPGPNPAAQRIALPLAHIRRQTGAISADLCAMAASGDSMEPTIRNGALLLLDRSSREAREGIHVIARGDDVLVKRIQPLGARSVRLISDNPRYTAEDMPLDDPSVPVRFIGRVIWVGQPL